MGVARQPTKLAAYLADRDVACPGCGYNLRGLARTECPECDRRLSVAELREAAARSAAYPRATIAALVAIVFANGVMWYGVHAGIRGAADPLYGLLALFAIPITVTSVALGCIAAACCSGWWLRWESGVVGKLLLAYGGAAGAFMWGVMSYFS